MTIDDIQFFVVTYNRPDLLLRQLESIAAQTMRPASITVLDDGPNPDTRRVVERFAPFGIAYERTERPGLWGNIYEAQQRADRKYVAVLHDDDRIHPRYAELVASVCSSRSDVTLLGCDTYQCAPDDDAPFSENVDDTGVVLDSRGFASFFFNDNFGNFPFFVYKTENFKRLDVYKYLDYGGAYGKHGDSAFVPLAVGDGKAVMLASKLANYGIHAGQAVRDAGSLPDARCWARVEAVFRRLLGDDITTFAGFSYAFRNFHRLKSGYRRRGTHDYSFREYLKYAEEEGAVSPYMNRFRFLCNHYTEKALLAYGRAQIRRQMQHLTI
jgi:glycosyltransferase involved in cell wall biosynthesis